MVPYWDVSTTVFAGAGALRSNAEDMLKYIAAQLGPPENDIERAMRATHEVQVRINEQVAAGLGWSVRRLGDRRIPMHGGGTSGYNVQVGFDPELRTGFVMLTNTGDFDDDIGSDFLRRGRPLDIAEASVPRQVLERYVGEYELAPGRAFVVRLEDDGTMTMQAPGNVRFRMHAGSDSTFFLKRAPWQFTFNRDGAGGVVTGFVADLEGSRREAKKVSDGGPAPAVVAGDATVVVPLAAGDMARYEGVYTLSIGKRSMDVRVFVEGGQLMAAALRQSPDRAPLPGGSCLRDRGGHRDPAGLRRGGRAGGDADAPPERAGHHGRAGGGIAGGRVRDQHGRHRGRSRAGDPGSSADGVRDRAVRWHVPPDRRCADPEAADFRP